MQRSDPRHTASYTHDAPTDVAAEKLRAKIRSGQVDGVFVEHLKSLPEGIREDVLNAEIQAAHETSIGTCKANFLYDPCPYFGGCLSNCQHLLVERGNTSQLVQIRGMRTRNEEQLRAFDEQAAIGRDLEPEHRARILTVIDGCRDAEARIEDGPPDGRLIPAFPEGEDRFVDFDE
jgi:hypothetical protein